MTTAVIAVQIDIGFGDSVHPAPKKIAFPGLIEELPVAHVRAYPPETVIAEKFEAMVRYGDLSSRLKDHYDLWVLSCNFEFEKSSLVTAIRKTFAGRKVSLPTSLPSPLSAEFASRPDKLAQWQAFLRRTTPTQAPPPFPDLVAHLREFFGPIVVTLDFGDAQPAGRWISEGHWQ